MSEDSDKASADAVEAARNSEQLALIAAVIAAQQQAPACQHQAPAPVSSSGSAGKWIAVGVGGSFLAVSLALSAVAVAISAVALTVCLLVLRGLWADVQKGRGRD